MARLSVETSSANHNQKHTSGSSSFATIGNLRNNGSNCDQPKPPSIPYGSGGSNVSAGLATADSVFFRPDDPQKHVANRQISATTSSNSNNDVSLATNSGTNGCAVSSYGFNEIDFDKLDAELGNLDEDGIVISSTCINIQFAH